MSNSPVDPAREMDGGEDGVHEVTHVSFRIKTDQVQFYRRMAKHFYDNNYISEPKLSILAKACLNIVGHKFAKVEEITYANYVNRELAKARGPNAPYVRYEDLQQQQQRPMTMDEQFRADAKPVIPPELRRASPVDKQRKPEWVDI